jgi:hypothetical protein
MIPCYAIHQPSGISTTSDGSHSSKSKLPRVPAACLTCSRLLLRTSNAHQPNLVSLSLMGISPPVVLLYWPRMKSEICSSLACSIALSLLWSPAPMNFCCTKSMPKEAGSGSASSLDTTVILRRMECKVIASGFQTHPCQGNPHSSRFPCHRRRRS